METVEIIEKLKKEGYTLHVIAKQSGVAYMRIYRHFNDGARLDDAEHSAIKAFAFVQPCFTRRG